MYDLVGHYKDLGLSGSYEIRPRGAREPSQKGFEIIQKRANNDLGQGGSSRKVEKSSDSGSFLR